MPNLPGLSDIWPILPAPGSVGASAVDLASSETRRKDDGHRSLLTAILFLFEFFFLILFIGPLG
jgi:hypothetical protein